MPCACVAEWQERTSRAGAGTLQPGGCPRCQTKPLRSLLWGRTLQKSLFCGSKQALLQCKTMGFAAPRRAFRIFLTMRWLHNLEIYGICLRIFHVAAISPLVCYFTFITLLPASFICLLPSWLPFILGVVRYVFE